MSVKPLVTPESKGGDFELPPQGVYLARCYKMADIGTQEVTSQFGTKLQRQIVLWWELLANDEDEPVKMADGEHVFSIMKTYTWSLNERANLLKDLNAWRGKPFTKEEAEGFDISNLVGKFVKINVAHEEAKNGNTYAKIMSFMPTKKTATPVNPDSTFSILEYDLEELSNQPKWIQDKINSAKESQGQTESPKSTTKEEVIDTDDVQF